MSLYLVVLFPCLSKPPVFSTCFPSRNVTVFRSFAPCTFIHFIATIWPHRTSCSSSRCSCGISTCNNSTVFIGNCKTSQVCSWYLDFSPCFKTPVVSDWIWHNDSTYVGCGYYESITHHFVRTNDARLLQAFALGL